MRYKEFFKEKLSVYKQDGRYRVFTDICRIQGEYPKCEYVGTNKDVPKYITMWSGNDYMVMGHRPEVITSIINTINKVGVGSGGTRNISGNSNYHVELERCLANWYGKESGLLFTSGYVANFTCLSTLCKHLQNCIIYSDEMNHNSIIEGIRYSGCFKRIFKHNDIADLESLLQLDVKLKVPKIIVFESVYSMDGTVSPILEILKLAKQYNALTYCDEVHAVGMYGLKGSGLCEKLGCLDDIDFIQGTLGKAIGHMGGYVVGNKDSIDFLRSFCTGFIFTTSLPPAFLQGAITAIKLLKQEVSARQRLHQIVTRLILGFKSKGIKVMSSDSHIVSLMIGDSFLCKQASDILLQDFGMYIQSINYPTVAKNTERLRLSPSCKHTDKQVDIVVESISEVFKRLGLL